MFLTFLEYAICYWFPTGFEPTCRYWQGIIQKKIWVHWFLVKQQIIPYRSRSGAAVSPLGGKRWLYFLQSSHLVSEIDNKKTKSSYLFISNKFEYLTVYLKSLNCDQFSPFDACNHMCRCQHMHAPWVWCVKNSMCHFCLSQLLSETLEQRKWKKEQKHHI